MECGGSILMVLILPQNISLSTLHTPPSSKKSPVIPPQEPQGDDETGILRDDRPQGHAFDLHAEDIDECQRGKDVHDVLSNGDDHGEARVLHANEPPRQAVEAQYGRCAPDDDIEIGGGEGCDILRGSDQQKRRPFHRHLQHDEQQGDAKGERHRAYQQARDGSHVPAP